MDYTKTLTAAEQKGIELYLADCIERGTLGAQATVSDAIDLLLEEKSSYWLRYTYERQKRDTLETQVAEASLEDIVSELEGV